MSTKTTVGCLCPPNGQRHPNGDTITWRDKLDFRTALAARKAVSWARTEDESVDVPDVLALLSEFYLTHCIESWTLRDAKGKAIEVSRRTVEQYVLSSEAAFDLAEVADDLYSDRILGPLVTAASKSSPPTQTNGSTSPTPGPGKVSRSKPSTPSSITPSPMAATGRT